MKRNFIYSKKSVRTLLLKLEPYFLSHAERGEPFQIQDFLGGIHLCRHFVPTPFRLPIPIFNFGGGDVRKFEPVFALKALSYGRIDKIIRRLRLFYKENPASFEVPVFAQKVY